MATNDNTKTAAYENYPNYPIMADKKTYTASPTGTPQMNWIEVMGADELTVEAKLTTAAAANDLIVTVFPMFADGSISTVALVPVRIQGPTLSAGTSYMNATYDVTGHTRVILQVQNANAAPQTIVVNWVQG